MKKRKKRLTLSKETVLNMITSAQDLDQVAGGSCQISPTTTTEPRTRTCPP